MTYDAQAYLLDRANIHDTITKLVSTLLLPSGPTRLTRAAKVPRLRHGVAHDPRVRSLRPRDRPRLRGLLRRRRPDERKGPEWSRSVVDVLRPMTATQHLLAGVVANLPQPAPPPPPGSAPSGAPRPDSCRAVANVFASLVREGVRGGGGLMQNGGRYEFELVRIAALEDEGRNPWRIRFHKAVATWENGNWAVFSPPDLPSIYNRENKE
ncbi:hypothetical protein Ct61P_09675 [Colletotrichum tofieldiae]|nr:hypothetical protein Ct61P_09675 [Colletotrichum tofieldiae]